MSSWRKGCLCGCLFPEECRNYEAPARVTHVIHHVVTHRSPAAFADTGFDIVPGEVVYSDE